MANDGLVICVFSLFLCFFLFYTLLVRTMLRMDVRAEHIRSIYRYKCTECTEASELQMPKNEIQFSTFFFQLSPIVGNNMVICVFRFVCVWRFSRPNIFFSLCWAIFFLYVTYREIWIIVTLYWAWHWSRRNRCALQPSRRVYHKSRTLFFYVLSYF